MPKFFTPLFFVFMFFPSFASHATPKEELNIYYHSIFGCHVGIDLLLMINVLGDEEEKASFWRLRHKKLAYLKDFNTANQGNNTKPHDCHCKEQLYKKVNIRSSWHLSKAQRARLTDITKTLEVEFKSDGCVAREESWHCNESPDTTHSYKSDSIKNEIKKSIWDRRIINPHEFVHPKPNYVILKDSLFTYLRFYLFSSCFPARSGSINERQGCSLGSCHRCLQNLEWRDVAECLGSCAQGCGELASDLGGEGGGFDGG